MASPHFDVYALYVAYFAWHIDFDYFYMVKIVTKISLLLQWYVSMNEYGGLEQVAEEKASVQPIRLGGYLILLQDQDSYGMFVCCFCCAFCSLFNGPQ